MHAVAGSVAAHAEPLAHLRASGRRRSAASRPPRCARPGRTTPGSHSWSARSRTGCMAAIPLGDHGCMELTVVQGDITEQEVDAVVNAANRAMRGGGGVDGAIHRAGGPAVLEDCVRRFPHGLATGEAGWTTAGSLPARWVIHVVGPNFRAGERDRGLLTSCYAAGPGRRRRARRPVRGVPPGQCRDLRLAARRRDRCRGQHPAVHPDRGSRRRGWSPSAPTCTTRWWR